MPKPRSVDDDDVLAALAQVFRRDGYDGATLASLAEATGLKRASLYHRFPGGKADMARAVLESVHDVFRDDVLAPLAESGDLRARLEETARRLGRFYDGGDTPCVLDTLSVGRPAAAVADALRGSVDDLIAAFAGAAREAGAAPREAERRARAALVRLEGGLVVARAAGDASVFVDVLEGLPTLILGE